MRGRPKELLRAEVVARVIERLSFGCYLETAAQSAGIGRTTLYRYLRDGRKAMERQDAGLALSATDALLADFVGQVDTAIAEAERTMVGRLFAAGAIDWRADLAHLERRFSERYGPRQRASEDLSKLTDDELKRRAQEELHRMEAMGDVAIESGAGPGAPKEVGDAAPE